MPSVQNYDSDSDYDARPETGRAKPHLDSDDSINEGPSSVPKRHHRFPSNDTEVSDDSPIIVEETQQNASATTNLIRQPTAFVDSNTSSSANSSQSGPSFRRVPIHSTRRGYVNTPELSAGSSGGLSQGHGPYKSLFRATSESRSNSKAPPLPPDAGLHILAEAANSPESAFSPVSAASPAPVPASTKRRKASPMIVSSPASSVPPPDTVSNAQPSQNASTSHISQPRQAKGRSGTGKGKAKAKAPPSAQPSRSDSRADAINPEHGQRALLKRQHQPRSPPPSSANANLRRNLEARGRIRPNPNSSYDFGGDYYPQSRTLRLHSQVVHEVCEKEPSLSPPPPKTWVSPGSSPATAYHYHVSAGTTRAEPSPSIVENSRRVVTPSTKPRMLTLLIEDRRHGTDDLAEVRVPLRAADEGYFWADAKQVCAALQGGPSRIDGPAKVLTMRGKYRHTFLRISAEGEETNQTLPIIVESVLHTPTPTVSSIPTPISSTGLVRKLSTMTQPLTPISNGLDLDGTLATPFHQRESVQRVGDAKKRKREASLTHIQPPQLYGSPEANNFVHAAETSRQATPIEHNPRPRKSRRNRSISSFDDGYMSDSPPGSYRGSKSLRKDLGPSTSHLHHAGYETDQPLSSVRSRPLSRAQEVHHGPDRKVGSRLQLPPNPAESASRIHDKIVSFLQDAFMRDAPSWNEFSESCAQIMSLSNAMLLKIYWYAQGRLDDWVGASTPDHLHYKKVEIKHVLGALGVSGDWYRECNETLSLAIAYGEGGERCEDARAVAASRDRSQKKPAQSYGPTDLLVLFRQVHEEYCERVNARREGSL
ncbi:hypothetical protein EI94DRAFT_1734555 [Lactarius quietus]|nr:hypothetical protein EI94DRAFT_1734555 [Lactarius quietus]